MKINDPIIAALAAAYSSQQQAPTRGTPSRLVQALASRRSKLGDAKYARLGALPPYGEIQHAETHGAQGGSNSLEAFQSDAYQDPGYQVF